MLRIGICDDNKQDREQLEDIVYQIADEWDDEFEIATFESGERLCEDLQRNDYDVILLDIQMKGMNGIETLQSIARINEEIFIIFISSSDEYLRNLYERNVLGFVDKPATYELVNDKLRRAKQLMEKDSANVFIYNKNGTLVYVRYSTIICMESEQHYIKIHTKNEIHKFKGKIATIWSKLESSITFCRPHRSYIINLKYLEESSSKVVVVNGNTITIGRQYKEDTQKRMFNYIQQIGGKYEDT